ncbi:MAG: thioesterase family protein [Solirubrobacteraceae bacterium]
MSASDAPTTPPPTAYFRPTGPGRFRATAATGGGWNPDEQHVSPLNGLLVAEIERFVAGRGADDGLAIARISFDILGVVALDEVDVEVEVVRPGRAVELLEGRIRWGGRTVLRAWAWRIARADTTAVAGGDPAAMPRPDGLAPVRLSDVWPGGYIASLEARAAEPPRPGRGRVWVRTPLALVEGRETSPLAGYVALVDTANGVAPLESPQTWAYPNVDLTIHLFRQPLGPWVGLDTTVTFGDAGQGLTASVLHDERGPVGRAAQILLVRPLRG